MIYHLSIKLVLDYGNKIYLLKVQVEKIKIRLK